MSSYSTCKTSYIFLKLQILAVCCVAFWLLYSPPSLEYTRFKSKTTKLSVFSNVTSSEFHEGDSSIEIVGQRNVELSKQSLIGDGPGTLPLAILIAKDEPPDVLNKLMSPTKSGEVERREVSCLKRGWIIKWDDRNLENTYCLPLSNKPETQQKEETHSPDHVIFNRVGKCGSRSVVTLLDRLARANNFYLLSSQTFNAKHIGFQNEGKLVSILSRVDGPFIYQRHLHFINFTKYGAAPTTYINIIRDPLERAISHYYFIRFGDEKKQERKFNSSDPSKYMSYEECVRRRLKECVGRRSFYIIPFFCGQDKRCTYDSEWAYNRAMENVERNYVAVGVLEEFHDTLQVFEAMLPKMFKGALKTHLRFDEIEHAQKSSVGVTQYKQKPSEATAHYMRTKVMKYEYMFYNWIKDRLHQQIKDLGLTPYQNG